MKLSHSLITRQTYHDDELEWNKDEEGGELEIQAHTWGKLVANASRKSFLFEFKVAVRLKVLMIKNLLSAF